MCCLNSSKVALLKISNSLLVRNTSWLDKIQNIREIHLSRWLVIRREPYKGEVTLQGGHRPSLPSMDVCLRLPHQGDRYPTDHHFGTTHKQTDPQPNHQKSLQMIALVSYFDKIIKLSAHQQSILSLDPVQCSISRNDRHVQVVFWAPGTQGRSRGINNVAGLVPVKQWPHYPLFACSTIVQNVFLQKVTIHLSKWFQWNNGLQASLPAVCLQCHLTIAKCISPTS